MTPDEPQHVEPINYEYNPGALEESFGKPGRHTARCMLCFQSVSSRQQCNIDILACHWKYITCFCSRQQVGQDTRGLVSVSGSDLVSSVYFCTVAMFTAEHRGGAGRAQSSALIQGNMISRHSGGCAGSGGSRSASDPTFHARQGHG